MPDQNNSQQGGPQGSGFAGFAFKRIAVAVVLIALVVWVLSIVPDMLRPSGAPPKVKRIAQHSSPGATTEDPHRSAEENATGTHSNEETAKALKSPGNRDHLGASPQQASKHAAKETTEVMPTTAVLSKTDGSMPKGQAQTGADQHAAVHDDSPESTSPKSASNDPAEAPSQKAHASADQAHETPSPPKDTAHGLPKHSTVPTGVIFVEAVVKPMDHELRERWWGWRPNDIINLTDNVNHMQLGILEVTRRSAIQLSERISRTGTTDSFNRHLENAVNWLMVKPERYWFPSPESKYKESLEELQTYMEQLKKKQASFYIRPDNVIPLFSSYEELLGSCDENLVKLKNEDGSKVSYFQADDYFYYAKGVASAMATILEAVHHDFAPTLENRHGLELLHHAIESCQKAAKLEPLLITDGALDGILANHRANMAAKISHARFYIGQLIKTLST